jgi:hypothetical protein
LIELLCFIDAMACLKPLPALRREFSSEGDKRIVNLRDCGNGGN